MMKPKAPSEHEDGLLEYLEDIIGSNRYLEVFSKCAYGVCGVCGVCGVRGRHSCSCCGSGRRGRETGTGTRHHDLCGGR